ncbi:ankyrin repeat domain-containing protein [Fluviicola taffensis]|uniref:ankyrin repeat domain-containing protein n=1 Tax=Fluviicola taffensis TaxID=191579 RepID=UPI003137A024
MNENLLNFISNNKVEELLKVVKTFNINQLTDTGDTPLMSAIRNEYIQIIAILLENGADPNFCNKQGFYPIHFATQKQNMEIVKLLVKYGAQIDQQDGKFGKTPLSVAISKTEGRTFIDYFLELGADITIPNKVGVTPEAAAKLYKINLR